MELWTLDELAERVEAVLADYPGQANGRVRAVPDQRAIRWYTTTGLIDRPAEMRGRTALYSYRHLLQLVAIKRRQSEGRTLAQIQSELAGATNQTLEPIAALPTPLPSLPSPEPATAGAASPAPEPGISTPAAQPRARFWADRPPEAGPGGAPHLDADSARAAVRDMLPAELAGAGAIPATSGASAPEVAVVGAVRIAEGVTVVLDQGVGVVDAERLAVAAGPLVAELRRQGILSRSSGDES
jgi:DNA-binding transcriptional MerR regulator